MNLKDVSIKSKLIGGFGVLAVIVLGVSVMSLHALSASTDGFSSYVHGPNARADVATQVRTAVDRRAIAARNLVLVTKPSDLEIEKAEVIQASEDVQTKLKLLKTMVATGPDSSDTARSLVSEVDRVESLYGPVANDIVALALSGKHDEAIVKMDNECRPLLAALVRATNAYAEYTRGRQEQMVRESDEQYQTQRNWMVALCVAALALAAAAGVFITRSITVPIRRAVDVASTVARGDLRSRIVVMQKDETGQLLGALADMNARLIETVSRVRESSGSIANASTEIATGNTDLSQRTEEQAASLEETAASMEELTSTVKQNTENAQQASALASSASNVAERGSKVVSQVVDTMHGISASSAKIAEITGMIEGIAFQTNILALNAAVEAGAGGRAGTRFCRCGERGAQPGATVIERGQGDQGADRKLGAAGPERIGACRAGRRDDGRSHAGGGARDGHHGGDRGGIDRAGARYRTGESGDHTDGRGHAAKRGAGGGSRGGIAFAAGTRAPVDGCGCVFPDGGFCGGERGAASSCDCEGCTGRAETSAGRSRRATESCRR